MRLCYGGDRIGPISGQPARLGHGARSRQSRRRIWYFLDMEKHDWKNMARKSGLR
jgi:hypothetical protein